jgi:hypothetical protein
MDSVKRIFGATGIAINLASIGAMRSGSASRLIFAGGHGGVIAESAPNLPGGNSFPVI